MRILDKSYKIASTLFPVRYENHRVGNSYHFTICFRRNTPIAIGLNNPHCPSPKELFLAKKFGLKKRLRFPFIHSETDAIQKLWSKTRIDSSIKLVNVRLNKFGQLKNARPCDECRIILNALNITDVYYSTDSGFEKL